MCYLYSITTNQGVIRALYRVTHYSAGDLPATPSMFPNWEAPVVRNHESGRELIKMRWGLPNPPQFGGINTNIRNPPSPHWRRWLKPARTYIPLYDTSMGLLEPERHDIIQSRPRLRAVSIY